MYVCDGQQLEALVLERAQVLGADLRLVLELGEVELLAQARLAQAVADLEHAGHALAAVVSGAWPKCGATSATIDSSSDVDADGERGAVTPTSRCRRARAAAEPRGASAGRAVTSVRCEPLRERAGERRSPAARAAIATGIAQARVAGARTSRASASTAIATGSVASESRPTSDGRQDALPRPCGPAVIASCRDGQLRRAGSSGR